jgi:lysophospholipase L1-like esterase
MRSDRTTRLWRNATKLALATLATLAALEIGLRIWDATHDDSPGLAAIRKGSADSLYAPHPFLGFELARDHASGEVNSLGLRGREVSATKPPGVFRIVCVGGSTTYGAGVPSERTYPARLEVALNELAPPGLRYEVLNCGVPGYTSVESLIQLELRLLDLQPDLVLDYDAINDANLIQGRGFRSDYTHARSSWRDPRAQVSALESWLIDHVRTWAWASSLLGRGYANMRIQSLVFVEDWKDVLSPPLKEVNQAGVATFLRNVRSLIAVARENGVQVGLMTFATWNQVGDTSSDYQPCVDAMNAGLRALASEEGLPIFDVAAAIGGVKENFWDPVHCNEQGCERQARAIAEQAAARGLWGLARPQ